jgi:cytochrome P450
MCCFILFMAAFPAAQKRARDEIDERIGPNRIPTLDKVKDFPYLNALMKETLRFRPPAPLGRR